jgi:nucleotidyltransferase/DNA polymerase involved in DNA repair
MVLYVRLPGVLAAAIRESRRVPAAVPLAVESERTIRDVCPEAARHGIRVGENALRARRLCPAVWIVAWEGETGNTFSFRLLDSLASISPTIEPDGPDSAYADLAGGPLPDVGALSNMWSALGTGFSPVVAVGVSRIAARACAECHLPADRLSEAEARWLWPEDNKVVAQLFRLGLSTFGEVALLGESALVYQFGKVGRLLYQRSIGRDFTPVRALWPPQRIEKSQDFSLEPITNEGFLREALIRLTAKTAQELRALGRHARRLCLTIQTERDIAQAKWVLPAPVQNEQEIGTALRRLRQQLTLTAAVLRIQVVAEDLDLPAAATASLFDDRSVERKLALAATRQRLHARYGIQSLRTLSELPIPKREVRRTLWKARQEA